MPRDCVFRIEWMKRFANTQSIPVIKDFIQAPELSFPAGVPHFY